MRYLFYIGLCLCLIILQTTIMPFFSIFKHFYDLLLLFILYLSLYRPMRVSLPVVFLLGFVMDNLSGSPFGLYLSAYFWTFLIVSWGTKFLHVSNRFLVLFVVAFGVFVENLIFLGSTVILGKSYQLPGEALDTIGIQVVWAIFTGPILLFLIRWLQAGFEERLNELINSWKEQQG